MSESIVKIGEEDVSLTDIAGIDLDQVAENYGPENLPAGTFEFRCEETEFGPIETKDGAKAAVKVKLRVVNCLNLVTSNLAPDDLIDRAHVETFWLNDLAQDLGRVKALLVGAGLEGRGSLNDLLNQFIGHQFIGVVKTRKDKNDSDIVYANLNLKKIKPVS